MSERPVDPEALLRELVALPPAERAARFLACSHSPRSEAIAALCAIVERLAVTEVASAIAGAAVVVQLGAELGGPVDRARAARVQGQSLAYSGDFGRALEAFSAAIAFAQSAESKLEEARARMSSIHALSELGRYAEAEQAGESARTAFLAAAEPALAARADANLGVLALGAGRAADALPHFDRARLALRGDTVALAQIESNRGKALMLLDRHVDARRAWEAALPMFAAAELYWAAAIVEGNLAELEARQGRLQRAMEHFERARQHLERDDAPAELARVMGDQADLLALSGLFDDAVRAYRDALPVLEASGSRVEIAKSRLGLAEALLRKGRVDDARRERAAAEAALVGLEHSDLHGRSLMLAAELALRADDAAGAQSAASAALEFCGDRPVATVLTQLLLSRIAQIRGDSVAAQLHVDQAARIASPLLIAPLNAEISHSRGRLRRVERDLDGAMRDFSEAVDAVERVRGSLQSARFRMAFQGRRVEVYDDLISAALELATPAAEATAFDTAERAKSRSLLEAARRAADDEPSELSATDGLGRELAERRAELDLHYSRLADSRFGGSGGEALMRSIAERLLALENQVAGLERRVDARGASGGLLARPATLAEVQAGLAADAALLMYYQLPQGMVAFVVRRDVLRATQIAVSEAELTAAVQRVLFQIRKGLRAADVGGPRAARAVEDVRRELAALFQLLIAPVRDALEGATRLRIVPHGPLHAVPMHALFDDGKYLLERFEISYAPNSTLASGGGGDLAGLAGDRITLVAVADENAPQIANEAARLGQIFPGGRRLLGESATTAAVSLAAREAAVLHLGCHGQFSAELPASSGVRLHDRWWTAGEIHRLRLKAHLVTLSGCDTGRSQIETGDEVLGLVRAFLAAGARALVVSLWTVQDESTAELMPGFYSRLVGAGSVGSFSRALREAQLVQLQSRPHPAHWAPFVCIGG
ncbi:MAG: CHAT domain-containing tetratricopeptide repeat protein [Phycisphaerae bacterium]|nr:CHAT domain-containing tetratricopeptide repeat protein [Phycisphaerae bacterium]